MIVIDFDNKPQNSIYYISSLIYKFLINTSNDFDSVKSYYKSHINKNELLFYYSLDWLFLIGKIKSISGGKLCY